MLQARLLLILWPDLKEPLGPGVPWAIRSASPPGPSPPDLVNERPLYARSAVPADSAV